MFKIIQKDKNSKARLGVLTTPHGRVLTPTYVIVATRGEIKCLKPSDIKKTKTQIVIANTYHLWGKVPNHKLQTPNSKSKTFLIKKLGLKLPTMTDSGGFQVFSLAFGKHDKAGKIFPQGTPETNHKNTEGDEKSEKTKRKNVRITDKGVYFKIDNPPSLKLQRAQWRFLGPELSIKLQEKLGADIIFAFDECTSFFDDFKYNKKAMERTHKWALGCLETKAKSLKPEQLLFGIVQGGRYKSLRVQSAKFIGSLPFDGFGIGGSFGKEEMAKMLKWVVPHLPEEKPRHLLGVGRIEDIFLAVENGVDLFDCVIPTREARHGRIWTQNGHYDIRRSKYSKDKNPLENGCKCHTCKTISRTKLYSFFKNPTTLANAQRWATIHNVYFFNDLVEKIRTSIGKGRFSEFKKKFLKKLRLP